MGFLGVQCSGIGQCTRCPDTVENTMGVLDVLIPLGVPGVSVLVGTSGILMPVDVQYMVF